MKDEPWRGDKHARCVHLEQKLANKRRRIAALEAEVERLRETLERAKLLFEAGRHEDAEDEIDKALDDCTHREPKPCPHCGCDLEAFGGGCADGCGGVC